MSLLDNIQNYYETLVIDALAKYIDDKDVGQDELTDIVCVALNHLPPRYFRYGVDMVYYTSPAERQELVEKAEEAVKNAIQYVNSESRG